MSAETLREVIKLDPNAVMRRSCEIDPDTIVAGEPRERLASFVTTTVSGDLDVGIWECDAYEERIDSYPVDEVMVIISGSTSLISDAGVRTDLVSGDVAFVPRGWKGRWIQSETIRKFTVMV